MNQRSKHTCHLASIHQERGSQLGDVVAPTRQASDRAEEAYVEVERKLKAGVEK